MPFPFAFARLNALQAAVRHSHNVGRDSQGGRQGGGGSTDSYHHQMQARPIILAKTELNVHKDKGRESYLGADAGDK
jgi:hypothetical protein